MAADMNNRAHRRKDHDDAPPTSRTASALDAGRTLARVDWLFEASGELRDHAHAVARQARQMLSRDLGPRHRSQAIGLMLRAEALLRALHDTIAVWALGPAPAAEAARQRPRRSVARRLQ